MPFITLIYLITNIAYFLVLSPKEILESDAVALVGSFSLIRIILIHFKSRLCFKTFSEKTMSSFSWVTPLFISFSTFGALSGCILGSSRIYYAAGRDGNLPQCFALISIKNFSPVTCIILQVTDQNLKVNFRFYLMLFI
jgi:amino acid transporter